MNQRTYIGPSFLELAKGAVDTFLKFRARDPSARALDRYMLLTFEDPPKHIKAGWRESQTTFMEELRNLRATGLTNTGAALGNALHLLNVNRLQSGIDNFGNGRYPCYLEPAVILLITCGSSMTSGSDVIRELEIPKSPLPGSELVDEPFRWDHRIFALVLRIAGHPPKVFPTSSIVPSDISPVDAMCEVTGGKKLALFHILCRKSHITRLGRSYCISSQRMLIQCLESLVQKVQSGVVLYLEKIGPDPPGVATDEAAGCAQGTHRSTVVVASDSRPSSPSPSEPAWYKTRRMIYVPRVGSRGYVMSHWPIPEPFRPEPAGSTLPTRTAQPHIMFRCYPCDPLVLPDFPFDKYELEPSPLTQFILEMKQPSVCWQVFVCKSCVISELGAPFGYMKASSSLSCVNLFIMPYNYPHLFQLLEELRKSLSCKPTQSWRMKFEQYLKLLPPYYFQPLRKALLRMGLGRVMPDACENYLSYTVLSYISKIKQLAQEEFTKICQSVTQSRPHPEARKLIQSFQRPSVSSSRTKTDVQKSSKSLDDSGKTSKFHPGEFANFRIPLPPSSPPKPATSNGILRWNVSLLDTSDRDILKVVSRARKIFVLLQGRNVSNVLGLRPVHAGSDELHDLPVAEMGNYQEYLKQMPPPLRDIEPPPVRQHAFGNPFKVDKARFHTVSIFLQNIVVGAAVLDRGSKP
ncbi:unnamed protein product [Soboliphyme baturini]|uniref:VWFA domain-containing protein n=1 Tax=Soboliphyme baturini TaxID=241478 RepID=A0A183IDB4_9BILA|nr:unnamed protein product [Soboliphyme baturini]